MRNVVYRSVILVVVSSLTTADYSGSTGGSDGYGKSGFDGGYHGGYVGEYAGQLGGGKALGELHDYGESQIAPEHGSQFDGGESHYSFGDTYGEQGDGGHKFSSSHYDGFSEDLDLSKFPVDVEAHHYTGGDSSEHGLGGEEDHHHQEEHQFEGHHEFQGDDDGGHGAQEHHLPYTPYDEPEKQSDYKGFNGEQIVPYSGHEEAEKDGEQISHYSGFENSQHGQSSSYEGPKAPSPSYSSGKTSTPIHEYSSEGHGSQGGKYQHFSAPAPSKSLDILQRIKGSGLKNFHTALQKNIMTIDHGKGGFSYSSLYRSP